MIEKKSAKGNLDGKRLTYILVGLVVVFGLVYVGFELFASATSHKKTVAPDPDEWAETEAIPTTETKPERQPQQVSQYVDVIKIINEEVKDKPFIFDPNYLIPVSQEESQIVFIPPVVDEPIRVPDVLPEYPGGMQEFYQILSKELKYPENAWKANIQGTVVIQFVVEKDGRLSSPKILHSVYKDLDEEAVRAILAMPKWNPGRDNGLKVRSYFQIPVEFKMR